MGLNDDVKQVEAEAKGMWRKLKAKVKGWYSRYINTPTKQVIFWVIVALVSWHLLFSAGYAREAWTYVPSRDSVMPAMASDIAALNARMNKMDGRLDGMAKSMVQRGDVARIADRIGALEVQAEAAANMHRGRKAKSAN